MILCCCVSSRQTGLKLRLFVLSRAGLSLPQLGHTRFTTWIMHMYTNQDLVSYVYVYWEPDFALEA